MACVGTANPTSQAWSTHPLPCSTLSSPSCWTYLLQQESLWVLVPVGRCQPFCWPSLTIELDHKAQLLTSGSLVGSSGKGKAPVDPSTLLFPLANCSSDFFPHFDPLWDRQPQFWNVFGYANNFVERCYYNYLFSTNRLRVKLLPWNIKISPSILGHLLTLTFLPKGTNGIASGEWTVGFESFQVPFHK